MTSAFTSMLASESLGWCEEDHRRPDPFGDLLAYSLATFVDGKAVTPLGYDVSGEFADDWHALGPRQSADVEEADRE